MLWPAYLGQERMLPYWEKAISDGKLHQAYLFSGPSATGKRTFALLLAQKLNCLEPESDYNHLCRQCQKISHGNHPDVRVIAPEGTFIKIDQIRDLISDANLKPLEGKKKVYIITRADQLKTEAANALLKVLEEPNSKVIIILTTAKSGALLPTIISRCLTITFNRVSAEEIAAYLVTRKGVAAEDARQVAFLADGRIGKALELLGAGQKLARSQLLEQFAALLSAASFLAYYELINQLLTGEAEEIQERLRFFAGWLRDLLLTQKGLDSLILHQDQITSFRALRGRYSAEALMDLITRCNDFYQLMPVNLNQRLFMENTFRRLWETTRRAA